MLYAVDNEKIQTKYYQLKEKFLLASQNFMDFRRQKNMRGMLNAKKQMIAAYSELSKYKAYIKSMSCDFSESVKHHYLGGKK